MFKEKIDVSVIVPIVERYDDLQTLYKDFSEPFKKSEKSFEFIFVVDGQFQNAFQKLKTLKEQNPEIKIIKFAKNFWESIALMVGFQNAKGEFVFTLSAYFQVEATAVLNILKELEGGQDLVITRRDPRRDSWFNKVQTGLFHWIIKRSTRYSFQDMACGLRGMRREVALSLELTGDLHRFIPILAAQKGYRVLEIPAPQRKEDTQMRIYGPGVYFRRVIDILALFFLIKFTRKPLRFFGLIGGSLFGAGFVISLYLTVLRLFTDIALAGRPLLLLGLVLMVVGIQVASLGLIGELIIFTNARDIKEYHIEEILD